LQIYCNYSNPVLLKKHYKTSLCNKQKERNIDSNNKKTPWSESASELYRPSDRRLSANLVQTFKDRGCHMVSVADPYGHILDFLNLEPLLFLPSFSSIVLTRLSVPRSRPTTFQKIW
jgi:hypothetical protein